MLDYEQKINLKNADKIFKFWLPAKMIPVFLSHLQINGKKPGHQMTAQERKDIIRLMKLSQVVSC